MVIILMFSFFSQLFIVVSPEISHFLHELLVSFDNFFSNVKFQF